MKLSNASSSHEALSITGLKISPFHPGSSIGGSARAPKPCKRNMLRAAAYQQGITEASDLLQNLAFRDFVVLYMAEGTKRQRNVVAFVNSNAKMVRLAHHWISRFTQNKLDYAIQFHIDHDEDMLKEYWGGILGISPAIIKTLRKSNSNQLKGRQFRSQYGLLTVRVGDTQLRARLQGWMDFVEAQW
jgi:hypothetical protein